MLALVAVCPFASSASSMESLESSDALSAGSWLASEGSGEVMEDQLLEGG